MIITKPSPLAYGKKNVRENVRFYMVTIPNRHFPIWLFCLQRYTVSRKRFMVYWVYSFFHDHGNHIIKVSYR